MSSKLEQRAILWSVGFLLMGILTIYSLQKYAGIEGETVLVAVLLGPIVIFLILSGKISELKTPGGLSLVFKDTLTATVNPVENDLDLSVEESISIQKSDLPFLQEHMKRISQKKSDSPVTLTLFFGRRYSLEMLITYIENLAQFPKFKFVVIIFPNNTVFGYFTGTSLLTILKNDDLAERFLSSVYEEDLENIRIFPGLITDLTFTTESNIEALEKMDQYNYDALIAVDTNRKLRGVVNRSQIINKLLLSISNQSN